MYIHTNIYIYTHMHTGREREETNKLKKLKASANCTRSSFGINFRNCPT